MDGGANGADEDEEEGVCREKIPLEKRRRRRGREKGEQRV